MVAVWIGLVVALIVTLTLCGVMLVRKFAVLLEAFADFVSLPAILDGVHRADPEQRPIPAVLRPGGEAAAERAARRQRSAERSHARREVRRARGRAIVAVDVTARDWFSS